jgi:phosphatidyl-myo-inositol dimannoside synthase
MPNVPVSGDIEGFGVVMLEAGLCGMPVVAADLEGISDVIRDGRNGHLVPSRDAEAFAAAILPYRESRAHLAEASRNAAAYTAGSFGWPAIAERYLKILGEVAGLTGPEPPRRLAPVV